MHGWRRIRSIEPATGPEKPVDCHRSSTATHPRVTAVAKNTATAAPLTLCPNKAGEGSWGGAPSRDIPYIIVQGEGKRAWRARVRAVATSILTWRRINGVQNHLRAAGGSAISTPPRIS
jgi:hypothetical protein